MIFEEILRLGDSYSTILLLILSHAVFFNHLRQFRALARIVQCISPRHLVSHSLVTLVLVSPEQDWLGAYLC